ncbi:unnamed protein product [Ilex paraguariensis]|uniref:PQ-loop repeat family protein / transmembrane family protein n=1 Tax=Ilex paraguariensis TaxID=185542 RepID=A0ABC8TQL4_9AQUA
MQLPTQFYTALLYAATTVVLVLQCLYYDHFLQWWRCRHIKVNLVKAETTKPLKPKSAATHSPVEVPRRRDFYFRSARSLAGSDTPPFQSYIKPKSGPSALERDADSSSEDEPLPPSSLTNPVTQPWRISRSGGYGTFLAATAANFPLPSNSLKEVHINQTGRRLLQEDNSNIYGQSLGWLMAAIYMGGRVPQIWLNIKRGSVEGLNPLMFIFALIANATYVGRSLSLPYTLCQ